MLITNVSNEANIFIRQCFFYPKLYIQLPGHIFVWHKLLFCYIPKVSSLTLARLAITCDLKSIIQIPFTFLPTSVTLTDLSGNTSFPQRIQKITSVGFNWLISIQCCLCHFALIMTDNQLSRNLLLFYCNPIGQLCLGGPGYSSCTVKT